MLDKIDRLPFVNEKNAFRLLIAMHLAGAIGLSIPVTQDLFKLLVPFNLLLTTAILLHFERGKSAKYGVFILLTFVIGFLAEVLGVKTGLLFGSYTYGPTLGFKAFEVPIAIGLNWVVLVYCSAHLSKKIATSTIVRILLGSLIMVAFDLIIEPVAIKFDFWAWEELNIPIRNYIGWFLLSVLLHTLFHFLIKPSNNSLAVRLLYIQVAFFLILNII